MGGKISKSGSYSLEKTEKKTRKRSKVQRTASMIHLPDSVVYEDKQQINRRRSEIVEAASIYISNFEEDKVHVKRAPLKRPAPIPSARNVNHLQLEKEDDNPMTSLDASDYYSIKESSSSSEEEKEEVVEYTTINDEIISIPNVVDRSRIKEDSLNNVLLVTTDEGTAILEIERRSSSRSSSSSQEFSDYKPEEEEEKNREIQVNVSQQTENSYQQEVVENEKLLQDEFDGSSKSNFSIHIENPALQIEADYHYELAQEVKPKSFDKEDFNGSSKIQYDYQQEVVKVQKREELLRNKVYVSSQDTPQNYEEPKQLEGFSKFSSIPLEFSTYLTNSSSQQEEKERDYQNGNDLYIQTYEEATNFEIFYSKNNIFRNHNTEIDTSDINCTSDSSSDDENTLPNQNSQFSPTLSDYYVNSLTFHQVETPEEFDDNLNSLNSNLDVIIETEEEVQEPKAKEEQDSSSEDEEFFDAEDFRDFPGGLSLKNDNKELNVNLEVLKKCQDKEELGTLLIEVGQFEKQEMNNPETYPLTELDTLKKRNGEEGQENKNEEVGNLLMELDKFEKQEIGQVVSLIDLDTLKKRNEEEENINPLLLEVDRFGKQEINQPQASSLFDLNTLNKEHAIKEENEDPDFDNLLIKLDRLKKHKINQPQVGALIDLDTMKKPFNEEEENKSIELGNLLMDVNLFETQEINRPQVSSLIDLNTLKKRHEEEELGKVLVELNQFEKQEINEHGYEEKPLEHETVPDILKMIETKEEFLVDSDRFEVHYAKEQETSEPEEREKPRLENPEKSENSNNFVLFKGQLSSSDSSSENDFSIIDLPTEKAPSTVDLIDFDDDFDSGREKDEKLLLNNPYRHSTSSNSETESEKSLLYPEAVRDGLDDIEKSISEIQESIGRFSGSHNDGDYLDIFRRILNTMGDINNVQNPYFSSEIIAKQEEMMSAIQQCIQELNHRAVS